MKHKAIENTENVCFKCLKKTEVVKIKIPALGYGGYFDCFSSILNLCQECIKDTNPRWWKLRIVRTEDNCGLETYEYEEDIVKFIKSFPIEGQELFSNRYAITNWGVRMKPQDWIDYNSDKLAHRKCKEYGLYSSQEKRAYKTRFPVCKEVFIAIYKDGSRHATCPYGAIGSAQGEKINLKDCDMSNKCHGCRHFDEGLKDW